jgi:hypothetical protein
VNDGQLLGRSRVGGGLSLRNWSTRIRWKVRELSFLFCEGKCGFKSMVLSAKDVLFSKFETWLEVEYKNDEEYQLSDHI